MEYGDGDLFALVQRCNLSNFTTTTTQNPPTLPPQIITHHPISLVLNSASAFQSFPFTPQNYSSFSVDHQSMSNSPYSFNPQPISNYPFSFSPQSYSLENSLMDIEPPPNPNPFKDAVTTAFTTTPTITSTTTLTTTPIIFPTTPTITMIPTPFFTATTTPSTSPTTMATTFTTTPTPTIISKPTPLTTTTTTLTTSPSNTPATITTTPTLFSTAAITTAPTPLTTTITPSTIPTSINAALTTIPIPFTVNTTPVSITSALNTTPITFTTTPTLTPIAITSSFATNPTTSPTTITTPVIITTTTPTIITTPITTTITPTAIPTTITTSNIVNTTASATPTLVATPITTTNTTPITINDPNSPTGDVTKFVGNSQRLMMHGLSSMVGVPPTTTTYIPDINSTTTPAILNPNTQHQNHQQQSLSTKSPPAQQQHQEPNHLPVVQTPHSSTIVFTESNPSKLLKRKTPLEKLVFRVTPNNIGDIWTWRKYGQKPIKGSKFPRSYYRCNAGKFCEAKKHVEKCTKDPNMYVITYFGIHQHEAPVRRKYQFEAYLGKSSHLPTVIEYGSKSTSNSSDSPINPDMLVATNNVHVVGGDASVTINDTQATSRNVIDPNMLASMTPVPSNNAKVVQGKNAHVTADTTHGVVGDTQIASCDSLTSTSFKSEYLVDPNMLVHVTGVPSNNAQVVQGDNAHVSLTLVPPFLKNGDTLVTSHNAQVARNNTFCTADNTQVASFDALLSTSYSTEYVINPKKLVTVTNVPPENAQVAKKCSFLQPSVIAGTTQVVVGEAFGSTSYSTNSMINDPNMLVPILSDNNDTVVASQNITKVAGSTNLDMRDDVNMEDLNLEEVSEDDILIPNIEALEKSFLLDYDYKIPTIWFD